MLLEMKLLPAMLRRDPCAENSAGLLLELKQLPAALRRGHRGYAEKMNSLVAYGECHCAGVESCCTLLVVEAAARPLLSLVADYG
ncbi:hypothetical protein OIU76_004111 [Salix suchowensis]|nr:hypothetical protein OIU76_004111 [Salix suchowensis]